MFSWTTFSILETVAVCIPLDVQIGKRWKKFRLQAEKLKEVR